MRCIPTDGNGCLTADNDRDSSTFIALKLPVKTLKGKRFDQIVRSVKVEGFDCMKSADSRKNNDGRCPYGTKKLKTALLGKMYIQKQQ